MTKDERNGLEIRARQIDVQLRELVERISTDMSEQDRELMKKLTEESRQIAGQLKEQEET